MSMLDVSLFSTESDMETDNSAYHFHLPRWNMLRELGYSNRYNLRLSLRKQANNPYCPLPYLYRKLSQTYKFDPKLSLKLTTGHGGVFNFDFSTDGSLLVAACERKCFLMFDPLNGKLLQTGINAHNDCVNCIKFLDSRTFATCSDDCTVKLWDSRYLKKSLRTLHGHSNWVKNIEYDYRHGLLVTSGFDGCVYTWDINHYSEECTGTRAFYTNGLMRSKLSPDGRKLVISTAGGYIMIVHDLNLSTLSEDLHGFKPNMYRLMQMSQSPMRLGYMYNHVFRAKRNRVELASDFPEGNEAEVLSSLQIHPHGWACLSRNTSSDENSEWTCLHDIQSYAPEGSFAGGDETYPPYLDPLSEADSASPSRSSNLSYFLSIIGETSSSGSRSPDPGGAGPGGPEESGAPGNSHSEHPPLYDRSLPEIALSIPEMAQSIPETAQSIPEATQTTWIPVDSNDVILSNPELQLDSDSNHPNQQESSHDQSQPGSTRNDSAYLHILKPQIRSRDRIKIYQNRQRLLYYTEEPNVGRGFIKELCFSNDGRIVVSPFAYGTRLLSLNDQCSELCDVIYDGHVTNGGESWPKRTFSELKSCNTHNNVVLCTKWSPNHCLFVSGCLNGEISFHQPVL